MAGSSRKVGKGPRKAAHSRPCSRISCWTSWIASLTRFIEGRLKLQINAEKSAVARPWHRSFLGFTVKDDPAFRRCIADKAVTRFKDRVRELTRRHRGVSLERMIGELVPYLRGWAAYFGLSQ